MKRCIVLLALLLAVSGLIGCAEEPKVPGVDLKITSFVFEASQNSGMTEDAVGTINNNNGTIAVRVSGGNISSLVPTIQHTGGTLVPEGAQDFSSPVFYRVLSADGLASMGYLVTVELYGDSYDVSVGAQSVAVGYAAGETATAVSNNVTLMSSTTNGCSVAWTTTDASLVATNGTVNRPAYLSNDQSVTLTATISKGTASQTTNFTLTIKKLPATDAEKVTVDARDVAVGYASGDSATYVTQNVTLTNQGPVFGTAISWTSTADAVIGTDGTVNRPAFSPDGDTNVTLTAVAELNANYATNSSFTLTVKQLADPAIAEVSNDAALLTITYAAGESATAVSNDITLSTGGPSGTTISWESDTPGVISTNGTVNRPAYGGGNATVSLTATVLKSSYPGQTPDRTETIGFTLTVIQQEPTDTEAVAETLANLSIGYQGSDSAASVTTNLILTNAGPWGTSVGWNSDATAFVGNDGAVTRPTYTEGEQTVTLTATATKNAVSDTTNFVLTLPALPPSTDLEYLMADTTNLQVIFAAWQTATNVYNNVTLSNNGNYPGVGISWDSTDNSVVSNDGTVTPPTNGTATVTLTATLTNSAGTYTKDFELTVTSEAPGVDLSGYTVELLQNNGVNETIDLGTVDVGLGAGTFPHDSYLVFVRNVGALSTWAANFDPDLNVVKVVYYFDSADSWACNGDDGDYVTLKYSGTSIDSVEQLEKTLLRRQSDGTWSSASSSTDGAVNAPASITGYTYPVYIYEVGEDINMMNNYNDNYGMLYIP